MITFRAFHNECDKTFIETGTSIYIVWRYKLLQFLSFNDAISNQTTQALVMCSSKLNNYNELRYSIFECLLSLIYNLCLFC